jgi:hypothetical protein
MSAIEVARRYDFNPAIPVRWMKDGYLLVDGSRLYLQHIEIPKGYRTRQDWLDAFFEAVAADKAKRVRPKHLCKGKGRKPKAKRDAAVDRELTKAGF